MNAQAQDRYNAVAIALHWLIALAIIVMLIAGLWMTKAIDDPKSRVAAFQVFQLHKSTGLTILALSLFRLIWRLTHKIPPLPEAMALWEKLAARGAHILFYVIMIAMPLTGWLYVSAGWSVEQGHAFAIPTIWYGLFQVPHIPGLIELPDPQRAAVANLFQESHEKIAWFTIALLGVHLLAALKHHIVNRDDVLTRMLPFLSAPGARKGPGA
jgi:cytochrome b561